MAKALDAREPVAALDDKFPLNDLPNDLLVSVFIAVGDLRWARHTVPLVCKAWAELYRSQAASPLHETLEVDFRAEAASTASSGEGGPRRRPSFYDRFTAPSHPLVHASRVISWAERRAGWVRKLRLDGRGHYSGALEDFSSEDLGRLVAVVGPSLTDLSVRPFLHKLLAEPFWDSLRASVVPHGRLRSLAVMGIYDVVSDADVAPLEQLAGSLEELELYTLFDDPQEFEGVEAGLTRIPESLCGLTELQKLSLIGHYQLAAIPAQISSLKKLKELTIACCSFSSLPKELGELSGLTKLDLTANDNLRNAPQGEAFPAELGKLKSLRSLRLALCRLRAVPAFVGELKSLEDLDLSHNELQIDATTLDFIVEGCPRLRWVRLVTWSGSQTPESRARLRAFKAKLLAKNPAAEVLL